MKNGEETKTVMRRFLLMGSVSVFLHGIIAVLLLLVINPAVENPAKENNIYYVELKRLQSLTEQAERIEPATLEKKSPEVPAVINLTEILTPAFLETAGLPEVPEEMVTPADIADIPILIAETAIMTPGGGMWSGAYTEGGGGNPLLASGTERGWGGSASSEGWGGGSGLPGSGGGNGSGDGNGHRRAGVGDEETGVYFAGMPEIIPPIPLRSTQPIYPEASRKRGEEGEVFLKVEVLANGRVGKTEVFESSGFARLDEAAVKTIISWRFKPALKGHEEVACWVNIPITYRLK